MTNTAIETRALRGRIVSWHRPAGASSELLDIIKDLEALARTQLALLGTDGHDEADPRPVLQRLNAGDIGDFMAATARVYERDRRRSEDGIATMDFVETQISKVLMSLRKILAEARSRLWSVVEEINDYLQRPFGHSTGQAHVATQLEPFAERLHAIGTKTMDSMETMVQVVEEWIDVVRTLGGTPSPQQQLTNRAKRIESLMKDVPVDADGTIRGGISTLVEHILRRGDLMVGDIHKDPSLKLWLAEHMGELHRNGVGVLMVEWNRQFDQKVLDDFMTTGRTAELKAALLPGALWGEKFVDADVVLLDAARGNGVRIVAMDTAMAELTNDEFGGRFVVSNPFWAAVYQQERATLPTDQRILVLGGAGHSRTVSGFEGLLPNVYSIDQYHSSLHAQAGVLAPGQAAVHPTQPFPLPTTPDESTATVVRLDNSDFIVRAPN